VCNGGPNPPLLVTAGRCAAVAAQRPRRCGAVAQGVGSRLTATGGSPAACCASCRSPPPCRCGPPAPAGIWDAPRRPRKVLWRPPAARPGAGLCRQPATLAARLA